MMGIIPTSSEHCKREYSAGMPVSAREQWLLYHGQSIEPKHLACGDEEEDGFCEERN
jgi:hypothetical protein